MLGRAVSLAAIGFATFVTFAFAIVLALVAGFPDSHGAVAGVLCCLSAFLVHWASLALTAEIAFIQACRAIVNAAGGIIVLAALAFLLAGLAAVLSGQ